MIFYRPTDGDVHNVQMNWRPRTCFLMLAMGDQLPDEVKRMKQRVSTALTRAKFDVVDAASATTGKDYLLKIWTLAVSCPVGIAIVHEGIKPETMANIYYELGWMQAYGRETVVIKIGDVKLPSDFVRTEYIALDANFTRNLKGFLNSLGDRADYYERLASLLEQNPLLAIDYMRRAYLLTGCSEFKHNAKHIFDSMGLHDTTGASIERLMVNF